MPLVRTSAEVLPENASMVASCCALKCCSFGMRLAGRFSKRSRTESEPDSKLRRTNADAELTIPASVRFDGCRCSDPAIELERARCTEAMEATRASGRSDGVCGSGEVAKSASVSLLSCNCDGTSESVDAAAAGAVLLLVGALLLLFVTPPSGFSTTGPDARLRAPRGLGCGPGDAIAESATFEPELLGRLSEPRACASSGSAAVTGGLRFFLESVSTNCTCDDPCPAAGTALKPRGAEPLVKPGACVARS